MEISSMQSILKGFMDYLMNSVMRLKSIWNREDIASAKPIQVNEVVSERGNPAQILNMGVVEMADVYGVNVKVEFVKNGVVESTSGGEYPACGYRAVTVIQRAVAESLLALGDAKAAQIEADAAASS
jgi:hypothetical protein